MDIFSSPSLSASQYVPHVFLDSPYVDALLVALLERRMPLSTCAMPPPLTTLLPSRRMIETEYRSLNQSKYSNFNATLLNDTASIINATLTNGTYKTPNYLFATLIASNATGDPGTGDGSTGSTSAPSDSSTQGGGSNPHSSLAM